MARTLTLLGSAVVFVIGLIAGIQMLLAKPPEAPVAATCEPHPIAAGDKLTSNLVTVNVFNASKKSGLANRVNSNSGAKPAPVTILTTDAKDPRVKLVAAQFMNKVRYSVPDIAVKEGVVIVIGDGFTKLKSKPVRSIVASTDVTTCVPVVKLP